MNANKINNSSFIHHVNNRITPAGYLRLQSKIAALTKRLEHLKISIENTRAQGDLRENAAYKAEAEEIHNIDKQLRLLKQQLCSCSIVDVIKDKSTIDFGATITLVNVETQENKTYTIVGNYESNVDQNQIAESSPLAQKLMNKQKGDSIKTNRGLEEFTITNIVYDAQTVAKNNAINSN